MYPWEKAIFTRVESTENPTKFTIALSSLPVREIASIAMANTMKTAASTLKAIIMQMPKSLGSNGMRKAQLTIKKASTPAAVHVRQAAAKFSQSVPEEWGVA